MALRIALVYAVPRELWIVMCVLALGTSAAAGCSDDTGAGGSGGTGGVAGTGGVGGGTMCKIPLDCNDENSCTENLCDLAEGTCSNPTFTNGTICSGEENPGRCVAGVCAGLCEFVGCGDGNDCTEELCDPADGSCLNPPVSDGAACDAGGDPGQCSTGLCVGLCADADCDDDKECTEDLCDRADGSCNSLNRPDGSDCELGGLPGRCMSGTCMDSALCREVDCGDGNECTDDVCNPANAACTNPDKVDGAFCETDGNPGLCSTGQCRGLCELVTCDDGNQCTVSLCDPSNGSCPNPDRRNGAPCDYGDLPGRCSAGLCVGLCAGVVCNDRNECTSDACDPLDGSCAHDPVTDGTSCDFGGIRGVCDDGVCADGRSWGTPVLIERGDFGAVFARIDLDPDGNVTAVWYQSDGGGGSTWTNNIWSNRYTPGGGWGTAVLIESDTGRASMPVVAVDPSGNAIAVWMHQDTLGVNQVWSNRYTPGGGWGTAARIENGAGTAWQPDVAVDPNGNAIAVWSQHDGSRFHLWSNRYTPSGSWGTAVRIENNADHAMTSQAGPIRSHVVATDAQGNAIVAWQQLEGSQYNIWSNRYTLGGGWGAAERIEDEVGGAGAASVAVDPNGNAIAVWSKFDGAFHNTWSNRYTSGSGWGTAVLLRSGAVNPHVVLDDLGNGTAIWSEYGTSHSTWSNRYTPGAGWGASAEDSGLVLGGTSGSPLSVNPDGLVIAVGRAMTSGPDIWSNRYAPNVGWGTRAPVETGELGYTGHPQVVIDSEGNATAVWSRNDGLPNSVNNIWSSRYE